MRIITVATHRDGYLPWLQAACHRYGVHLQILGWGLAWQGFQWRVTLLREAMARLQPGEFVCVVDVYDVLLLRDPVPDLEATFEATGARVVVACEHPNNWVHRAWTTGAWGRCRNRFLNAGMVAGRAADLADFYARWFAQRPDPAADDQRELVRLCRREPPDRLHIDCDGVFCVHAHAVGPIAPGEGLTLRGHGDAVTAWHPNGQRPFFIHAYGASDMDDLIQALGYPVAPADRAHLRRHRWRTRALRTRHYVSTLLWPLLIALIVWFVVSRRR